MPAVNVRIAINKLVTQDRIIIRISKREPCTDFDFLEGSDPPVGSAENRRAVSRRDRRCRYIAPKQSIINLHAEGLLTINVVASVLDRRQLQCSHFNPGVGDLAGAIDLESTAKHAVIPKAVQLNLCTRIGVGDRKHISKINQPVNGNHFRENRYKWGGIRHF